MTNRKSKDITSVDEVFHIQSTLVAADTLGTSFSVRNSEMSIIAGVIGHFYTRGRIIRPDRQCDWTHSASSSINTGTGTRRIIRLEEEHFVVLRSRSISKYASVRLIIRLVPVFIQEEALCVQSKI